MDCSSASATTHSVFKFQAQNVSLSDPPCRLKMHKEWGWFLSWMKNVNGLKQTSVYSSSLSDSSSMWLSTVSLSAVLMTQRPNNRWIYEIMTLSFGTEFNRSLSHLPLFALRYTASQVNLIAGSTWIHVKKKDCTSFHPWQPADNILILILSLALLFLGKFVPFIFFTQYKLLRFCTYLTAETVR